MAPKKEIESVVPEKEIEAAQVTAVDSIGGSSFTGIMSQLSGLVGALRACSFPLRVCGSASRCILSGIQALRT